ncbi:MAG: hypothetical protein ACOX1P_22405 [Thermoguttaceae bacterium]|jgi:hypothetical protein
MRGLSIGLGLIVALLAVPAAAQPPKSETTTMRFSGGITPGEVTATPEMWFYQQQVSRHDDPKVAVRRKAEFRSAQRDARLASQRWYGLSNSRPVVSTDPIHGEYSAAWTSGNLYHPYRWTAASPVIVVNRFDRSRSTY